MNKHNSKASRLTTLAILLKILLQYCLLKVQEVVSLSNQSSIPYNSSASFSIQIQYTELMITYVCLVNSSSLHDYAYLQGLCSLLILGG